MVALIVILSILGFIAMILVMPICYKGRICYDKSKDKFPRVNFRVSYLFIIRIKAVFNETLSYSVRIAGIPLMKSDSGSDKSKDKKNDKYEDLTKDLDDSWEPPKQETSIKNDDSNSIAALDAYDQNESDTSIIKIEATSDSSSTLDQGEQTEPANQKEENQNSEETQNSEENQNSEETQNKEELQNIEEFQNNEDPQNKEKKSLTQKLRNLYDKIKAKVIGLYDKIKQILRNIEFYLDLLDSDEFRFSLSLVKKKLGKLLKCIFPRRVKGSVAFGFDNPETTGKVLAYSSLAYMIYKRNLVFDANFEAEELEINADLSFRGHFNLITIILIAIKVYFNKNVRKLLFEIKNKDKLIARKYRSKGAKKNGGE